MSVIPVIIMETK